MKYETEFDLGDHVWGVSSEEFKRIVKCKPCANTGKIIIGDESLVCPKCNGRSTHTQYAGHKFFVSTFDAIVGQVRLEHTDPAYDYRSNDEKPNPEITYMLSSTGVRSGQVWSQERLFESLQAAQVYCDKKNGLLPEDEAEDGKAIIGMFGEVLPAEVRHDGRD